MAPLESLHTRSGGVAGVMAQSPVSNKDVPPKLLAVSFSYPPQTEPRAIQVSRLIRHLSLPTVLVCEGSLDMAIDVSSDSSLHSDSSHASTVRVPFENPFWREFGNRVCSRFKLPVCFRTPDHLGAWKKPVVDKVEELIRVGYQPDVLVTFAFPLIDNIIGLELKRTLGIPWLAHFSDPWVDNPFKGYDRLTKAFNARYERQVIELADRIVFTSAETAELVMTKYDSRLQSKVRVVPHAYESELFDQHSVSFGDKLAVRYLGEFYLGRTPKPLFMALEMLSQEQPDLVQKFRFELVGDIHELDLNELGLAQLPEDLVVKRPRVGYDESLSLMSSAAGLMVIDAPSFNNKKSVFLPSKLIEYIGAGRPIVGLTPAGAAADLISKLGGWVAEPGNAEQLANAMRKFLTSILESNGNREAIWGNPEVRKEFEADRVARKFQEVVTELAPRTPISK